MHRQPSLILLATDGSVIDTVGGSYGEAVSVDELPPHLPLAVLAVEDRRFYEHFGLDLIGLARAVVANLRAGRVVQGGSTITQQLAKNLFLTPERTVKRKVQEFLLALWLEQRFSKEQILSLYLNRVYLGAGAYGVDAAARHYFGKSAQKVTVYEAALLAGLLKAPSRYNPVTNADAAESRAELVLGAMVDAGFLSPSKASLALQQAPGLEIKADRAHYFTDWIFSQIEGYVGASQHDLTVQTTLDARLQRMAEREVAGLFVGKGAEARAAQAALVALSPEGAVRAMVGGRDYRESQFNRVTQARRQPGSAFKLFVFLAGLENGLRPDREILDAPVRVEMWAPRNYRNRYFGEVTLREGFARSLNSVAVRVSEEAGRQSVVEAARRLGIRSNLEAIPSIALGTSEVTLLELTSAYGVFANQGNAVWPYAIEEIRDRDGGVLFRRSASRAVRVVASRQVEQMNDLLHATVVWGTGKAAALERPTAGKTGTSQDFRDGWFVGFTAELVAGVWIGNDDGTPMAGVTGGSLPATLWRRFMARALDGTPPRPLPDGGTVVASGEDAGDKLLAESREQDGFIEAILRRLKQSTVGGKNH